MTRLQVDPEGSGSYEEIVEYVRTVLEENFVPTAERATWPDPYGRGARAITQSILNRLGIQFELPTEEPDGEA